MGSVVSVRVPPDVKREMDELKGEINWSEEIREFIKKKIKEYRKKKPFRRLFPTSKPFQRLQRGRHKSS